MVRMQVRLREDQVQSLRKLAHERHLSVTELIRRGLDQVIASCLSGGVDRRKQRAIAACGRFRSGHKDIAIHHDRYLAEGNSR